MDNFMEDMARGGTDPKMNFQWANTLMGNFVRAKIGINLSVFAKQLTSVPAYLSGVDVKDIPKYTKYVAEFWSNPVKHWKELSQSDYLQKRYSELGFNQLLAENAQALKKKGFNPKKMPWKDYMMLLTKFGDKTAIITGGYGYYRVQQEKYKKMGMSVEQAKKMAMKDFETQTRLNQQSSELTDLSWIQRYGSIGRMFTMFQNSPLQYLRLEMAAVTNIVNRRGNLQDNIKNFIIYHFVLPTLFQAISQGITGGDVEDYYKTWTLGSFAYIFILGDVIENVWDAAQKGQGWGMSNYPTALNTQFKKALAELTEMKALDFNDMGIYETIDATKDMSILMGDLMGVPVNNVIRYYDGIHDLSTGRSKNYWRAAGWSDYALGIAATRSDEMGLVKRNINKFDGRWVDLKREAREVLGREEFKKKEQGLKKLHDIYTTFGLENEDVNFLRNRSKDNTERAEYLIELEEDMGFSFRSYYGKLKRKGVVTDQLDEKFKELKKEQR
jgi:hypothetical protein